MVPVGVPETVTEGPGRLAAAAGAPALLAVAVAPKTLVLAHWMSSGNRPCCFCPRRAFVPFGDKKKWANQVATPSTPATGAAVSPCPLSTPISRPRRAFSTTTPGGIAARRGPASRGSSVATSTLGHGARSGAGDARGPLATLTRQETVAAFRRVVVTATVEDRRHSRTLGVTPTSPAHRVSTGRGLATSGRSRRVASVASGERTRKGPASPRHACAVAPPAPRNWRDAGESGVGGAVAQGGGQGTVAASTS